MKLYSENENYKLYQGSMLDMLEAIDKESIDSIITDPPYELNFMNKGWDNSGIAFQKETWKKCYEVLKPGGYLLAFGGSRTFHRIAVAIEDAGFEIRDTIMWLYGSGFPKSMDISKSLDKRNGRNPNVDFKEYLNMKRKEKNYSLADINKMMNVATNGGGFASSIMGEKENIILPTKENYLKLKEILELDNRYDELINTSEAKREVIGTKKSLALPINDQLKGWGEIREYNITAPSTDLAKQWQGWGTALKPSFEPIIVARKPFKGSLVDNVIEYGVGGINIDECRVETSEINRKGGATTNGNLGWKPSTKTYNDGRFPANTILTYDENDFDEVCGGFPNTSGDKRKTKYIDNPGTSWKNTSSIIRRSFYDDGGGSASRYFYCAKASKKDRDIGLKDLVRKNVHPTVKPCELMQYLVRLVSPPGAIILDCFNGSGSTGKAVMYENIERDANYKYIGIELTEEYLPIAKARIEYISNDDIPVEDDSIIEGQTNIFDFMGE